jgi:uncharacterized protein
MVSSVDVTALARAWRERAERRRVELERRQEESRRSAREAARALVDELGASEVWLFGSLAEGRFHERSDVDLAVRGIPDERYFAALARVSAIVGGPVDLVPLETCPQSLAVRVRTRGLRLDV